MFINYKINKNFIKLLNIQTPPTNVSKELVPSTSQSNNSILTTSPTSNNDSEAFSSSDIKYLTEAGKLNYNDPKVAEELRDHCSKLYRVPFPLFGGKLTWDNVIAISLILVNAAILIVATIQSRKKDTVEAESDEEKRLRIANQSLRIVFGVFCLFRVGYEIYIYKFKNIAQSMTSRIISIIMNSLLGITFIVLASINLASN